MNTSDLVSGTEKPAWVLKLRPGAEHQASLISSWLVKVMLIGIESSGNVNAEITPPNAEDGEWGLVLRFQSMEQVSVWQASEALKTVLDQMDTFIDRKGLHLTENKIDRYSPPANVATAIVTHIKPGKEIEYRDWVSKIHIAQANAAGYRGTFLQAPAPGSRAPWITLLRFDSAESLDTWFESDQRAQIIEEAKDLLRYDLMTYTSAFPGWFPTDASTGQSPPRWKTAMLVLLALYPLLSVLKLVLPPLLEPLGPALSLFISLTVSVCIISLMLMPLLIRIFGFWLYPTGHNPQRDNIRGYLMIAAIYMAMITASSLLLPK